ncbi:MAG: hypothetical protein CM15mP74_13590 [Halieaceae bacterium]|nr:MAG: hypothetical protein CM15mP74_13590 [Halieaceae bacterium]
MSIPWWGFSALANPDRVEGPFALRRASLGVIRILIERSQPLPLNELLRYAFEQHTAELAPDTVETVLHYILERLGNWYDDAGIHISVVRAVLATEGTDLFDIDLRVKALAAFAQTDTAEHLAAANKRVANILAKAGPLDGTGVDADLLTEAEETALLRAMTDLDATIRAFLLEQQYELALGHLAQLRRQWTTFESVMVNSDEPAIRLNRLRLLSTERLFTEWRIWRC